MVDGGVLRWLVACGIAVAAAACRHAATSPYPALVQQALDVGDTRGADRAAEQWLDSVGGASADASGLQAAVAAVRARLVNGRGGLNETLDLARRAVSATRGRDAAALHALGDVLTDRWELEAAIEAHERALSVSRQSVRADDTTVQDGLERLALPLILGQRFEWAEQVLRDASGSELAPRKADSSSPRLLFLRALLERQRGAFDVAEPFARAAAEAFTSRHGPTHPATLETRQLLGELRFLRGDLAAADRDFRDVLDALEDRTRPDHPRVAQTLSYVAFVAEAKGDIDAALLRLERADAIADQWLAPCHRDRAGMKSNLAEAMRASGRYGEARRLYDEALATFERCLEPNNQLTATVVHNLGLLSFEIGDLSEAERYQQRAVQMWTDGLGAGHPYVARGLDALAEVALAREDQARALTLYRRALAVRRAALGPRHPDVAWTLVNVARLAVNRDPATALRGVEEALGIYATGGLPQDPDHQARALLLLGAIQSRQRQGEQAYRSFEQALEARVAAFGASHPLTAQARAELASSLLATGRAGLAVSEALEAERVARAHLRLTVRSLPERQALAYATSRARGLDVALSANGAWAGSQARLLDALVRSRAVVLDELIARSRVGTTQPELRALFDSVGATRQRFATLLMRSIRGDEAVSAAMMDQGRREKEQAEIALSTASEAVRLEAARADLGLADVARALPPDSVLVSFVQYERLDGGQGSNVTRSSYAAFALPAGSFAPSVVAIGPADRVEQAVFEWRRAVAARAPAERAGERLRRLVWDSLPAAVKRARRVLIVPDGALNLVSFAALPEAPGRFLIERGYRFHYLSAERDLVRPPVGRNGTGVLAIGAPAFDLAAGRAGGGAIAPTRQVTCVPAGALRFSELPGAGAEAEDVVGLLRDAAGVNPASVLLLRGEAASESAVRRAVIGRRVLHFATHGFVFGADCLQDARGVRSVGGLRPAPRMASVTDENPLLLSGLALAGANGATVGGEQDGVLTAEEVAGMDLSGVEWAVLSACDTAIGTIHRAEGVMGLRRAFQVAGAATVIMSLWSVEDQGARRWMRRLYQSRLQGLPTDEAVHAASLGALTERRRAGESVAPFHWAPFVASGDWR